MYICRLVSKFLLAKMEDEDKLYQKKNPKQTITQRSFQKCKERFIIVLKFLSPFSKVD